MSDKKIPLIVEVLPNGMLSIDDKIGHHIKYANIKGMYKTESTQGSGLQTNSINDELNGKIKAKCDLIATSLYELQDLLDEACLESALRTLHGKPGEL
ncbi:hypothetical protein [Vibrio owensii]|uniref:hypothetical protein n=1 Tax=Vibrio harveyi group TaxID=717610 RepID=UPI003CC67BD7